MGALTGPLLLSSQHSRQLILAAVVPPQGALLQPVALFGDSDGGERLAPRWGGFARPGGFLAVNTGCLDILNES